MKMMTSGTQVNTIQSIRYSRLESIGYSRYSRLESIGFRLKLVTGLWVQGIGTCMNNKKPKSFTFEWYSSAHAITWLFQAESVCSLPQLHIFGLITMETALWECFIVASLLCPYKLKQCLFTAPKMSFSVIFSVGQKLDITIQLIT